MAICKQAHLSCCRCYQMQQVKRIWLAFPDECASCWGAQTPNLPMCRMGVEKNCRQAHSYPKKFTRFCKPLIAQTSNTAKRWDKTSRRM
jgi:hypothetical protein